MSSLAPYEDMNSGKSGESSAKKVELEKEFKRKCTIIFVAIEDNNLNLLKEVLEPQFYHRSVWGDCTLLQLAIIRQNKDVFHYILSLDDYPLEIFNKKQQNALMTALSGFFVDLDDIVATEIEEYYALELIKKGVEVHELALHQAAARNYIEVAKLLLSRGFDPNIFSPDEGTPLHAAIDNFTMGSEVQALLLSCGADLFIKRDSYSAFELALNKPSNYPFYEILCLYALDEHSSIKMHLSVLLKLARQVSPHFESVVARVGEIAVDLKSFFDFYGLFLVNERHMKILVEKCGFIKFLTVMANYNIRQLLPFTTDTDNSVESLVHCIETGLGVAVADFVPDIESNVLFASLCHADLNESTVLELVCYLLSYGLELNEMDLQMIYHKYGYCDLFKFLLHMDFKMGFAFVRRYIRFQKSILPMFIYDVTLDLRTYIERAEDYSARNVEALLDYFANPELKSFCNRIIICNKDVVVTRVKELPAVPLLLQLARDTFRKYLIDTFAIKTARQFYTRVNRLPISNVHKKIITFETKIY